MPTTQPRIGGIARNWAGEHGFMFGTAGHGGPTEVKPPHPAESAEVLQEAKRDARSKNKKQRERDAKASAWEDLPVYECTVYYYCTEYKCMRSADPPLHRRRGNG